MKKAMALILTGIMLCGSSVMAEDAGAPAALEIKNQIENDSYVISIPVEDGDQGWYADPLEEKDGIVKLAEAGIVDGFFTAKYEAVSDGDATVTIRHFYTGTACDQVMTWDLHVEGGVIQEATGGSNAMTIPEDDQEMLTPYISGEWAEAETQFSLMTVAENPELGWDVEIVSPVSHGAYVFKTTMYSDCEKGFVYDKGKYWDVPVTDSEEEPELGEAKVAGTTGSFTFDGDENSLKLVWQDDQRPDETIVFERMDADVSASVDTADWKYYTFEGSSVAMKIPADFEDVGEPAPGVTYNCRNADVLLQVQIMDGDFKDRDMLMEYLNNQEYIIRATQIEFNGVELVYAEGGDDGAQVYAVISPEGTTYEFVFIPQSENGDDVIQAITETICHSDEIPEM